MERVRPIRVVNGVDGNVGREIYGLLYTRSGIIIVVLSHIGNIELSSMRRLKAWYTRTLFAHFAELCLMWCKLVYRRWLLGKGNKVTL